ncbi:class I SAM-dependent methyltransferase [Bacillus aquiflavi]|uniref:class I SAM-dependent methyltransferase n=1 Tax=Bacillus aquiflavi TaxID=2672567 RepID=UPI001CA87EE4|nr:class I SAM-dependent methyltransferase [Bacillus aquiflavi]UAC48065.1 class I SAM-dependent methyltransferase [Bacillus aquiflavi]
MQVKDQTISYFKNKASKYDLVEEQAYWQLSDKLLWDCLSTILNKLPKDFTFLDAGGGTGRWSEKILENYPLAKGYTYDLSEEMLNEARRKKEDKRLNNRWNIIQGDLHNIKLIENNKVDIAFNFHNVLGFVKNPEKVINEIMSKVKSGGYIVSFVPSVYHAIFFNISLGHIEEAKKASNKKGRFTAEMPYIHLFTPKSIEDIYIKKSIEKEYTLGFPAFIYPGYQETQLEGNTEKIKDILENEEVFNTIYQLEKSFLTEETASRGNNLFIVGRKK